MRSLALTAALAATLSATGCYVSNTTPTGELDLAWRFRASDASVAGDFTAADSGCSLAAITDVDLTVSDTFGHTVVFRNYPCEESGSGLPRAFVSGLPPGDYDFLATAYRVDAPVFETSGGFTVPDGGTRLVNATLDVLTPAPLTIYFTQRGAFTCSGTPEVRFDIFFPASSSSLVESNTVACTSSFGFTATHDQSTGQSYGVDLFALNAQGASVNEHCLVTVRHTGFPVTIDLFRAPDGSCPP
jgi:hypothetical protein